jgi:predicted RNA methylase
MSEFTATYSTEDNKLRLYTASRLDSETYAMVKAAGFSWAPKQQFFVAPMWTPSREDLLIQLAGEIEDESSTMEERAAQRAERFESYSESRTADAKRASKAVESISENIPFGQPILVGHHSQRHAERDAKKIEQGLRQAAKMWETAAYWEYRANASMRHAAYKANPVVTARRIKKIESERRKRIKEMEQSKKLLKFWGMSPSKEQAIILLNHFGNGFYIKDDSVTGSTHAYSLLVNDKIDIESVTAHAKLLYERNIKYSQRWIQHFDNRLAYERAFLLETAGERPVSTGEDIVPGGTVWVGDFSAVVLKVTRGAERKIVKVVIDRTWRFSNYIPVERITSYQAPTPDQVEAVNAVIKIPTVNFPGEGFIQMAKADWKEIDSDRKCLRTVSENDFDRYKLRKILVRGGGLVGVYITDEKIKERPAKVERAPLAPAIRETEPKQEQERVEPYAPSEAEQKAKEFRNLAKTGVQVVSSNQLFPTPSELARELVLAADIGPGMTVLEPSAGTGRLLHALATECPDAVQVTAVEINQNLCNSLRASFSVHEVIQADFLEWGNAEPRSFNRIIMNPPFENGADIKHILLAWRLLAPGGVLVAICADGPRQRKALLEDLVEANGGRWNQNKAGAFAESGTQVNTVMLVVEKP